MQSIEERTVAVRGETARIRNGEPRIVPESDEVARFAAEQRAADGRSHGGQTPPELGS